MATLETLADRYVDRLAATVARLRYTYRLSTDEAVQRIERIVEPAPASPPPLNVLVREALRHRARRNERLGVDLFRDPAWDILLELLVAHHEGRAVSVSGLCFVSGVPATTALRYVDRLEEEGLIRRDGDSGDHRRVLVTIAPDRIAAVEAVVHDMATVMQHAVPEADGDPTPVRS